MHIALAFGLAILTTGGFALNGVPNVANAACFTNAIVCENSLSGNPASEWDVSGSGDPTIQGFSTDISVNRGSTIGFKVNTHASAYHIDIYRIGFYAGNGARKVGTILPSASLPQTQPACLTDTATGLVDCGNWGTSAFWAVPASAVSGVYIGRLVRSDTLGASHVLFIVRDDGGHSDLLFQTSDTTWQAYNKYGGTSLYSGSGPGTGGKAYKVSYNRPLQTRQSSSFSAFFNAEYPMVRWLEANGYNVSYASGIDTDRHGSLLTTHKALLSVGHDEYWSGNQRANVEAARGLGLNLGFFSGNEIFWKTRWENSIDGTNSAYRTLVTYKETLGSGPSDPKDPPTWTGTWRDARFSPPGDGGRPENSLSGTLYQVNYEQNDPITVPATYSKLRFWRNTAVAALAPNTSYTASTGTLGFEWDVDADNGSRPNGLFDLSSTTRAIAGAYLLDNGGTYGSGTPTHSATLYKHSSGALVFGAGSVQWSWGLDAHHDRYAAPTDINLQQATVNLFADMSIQPASLQAGLIAATGSSDTTPPTSTITSPAAGLVVSGLVPVTITGTATDAVGIVAGVEVSVDGGTTWHKAVVQQNWSYNWTPPSPAAGGTVTVRSRAVDDSGNLETPKAGVSLTLAAKACPCTLWGPNVTPAHPAYADSNPVEVGVAFRADLAGYITGVRFFKGIGATGTHVGHLWSSTGQLMGTATFSGETASGWQQVSFPSAVAVQANTRYIASYYAPVGAYALTFDYFATAGTDNYPLHAPVSSATALNGVYLYASNGGFPSLSYRASNYWVDPVFATTPLQTNPPTVTAQTPAPNTTNVGPTPSITATFSEPIASTTLSFVLRDSSNTLVPGTAVYNTSSLTATLQPTNPLSASATYTATVGVSDLVGQAMTPVTWSFSTGCPCTVWAGSGTPAIPSYIDPNAVELGVKFRSDLGGWISAIRFYKGANSIGTHTGHLWSATGQLLATATFANETASGWQEVTLGTPVGVQAGVTYVASYLAPPKSGYALTQNAFATSGVDSAPLHALMNGVDGANGVFLYAPSGGFPTQTNAASNYWVDVVFVSAAVTTTTAASPTCPCTVWGTSGTPAIPSYVDPNAVELAVKIRSSVAGSISGIRFYKGAGTTGTHLAHLWTTTGQLLATATFTSEAASGWQQVMLASPVAIQPNVTYIASYLAPANSGFALTQNAFTTSGVDAGPLHVLANGVDGPNGVFLYAPSGGFPTQTNLASNYWVDVVLTQP